jgi:UDP-N-acetylglucosamine:LPS N-acetylglucosamine transferase
MKLFVISTVAAVIALAPAASAKEASDARDLDQAAIQKCMDKNDCRKELKKAIKKIIKKYQHQHPQKAAAHRKPKPTQLPANEKPKPEIKVRPMDEAPKGGQSPY